MDIYNQDVNCGRVSSLFVRNSSSTRWVEVGWYEDNAQYACLPTTDRPWRLGFVLFDGLIDCFKPTGGIGTSTATSMCPLFPTASHARRPT